MHTASEPGKSLSSVGEVGGPAAAFDNGLNGDLYVALHDGAIKRSGDAGRHWTVVSKPD